MKAKIEPDPKALAELCARYGVQRLALFGSALRDDFRPDSDVDILVEFAPGVRIGFLGLAELEQELTALLGRDVDLRTPGELSRYFRQQVLNQSETLYAAA